MDLLFLRTTIVLFAFIAMPSAYAFETGPAVENPSVDEVEKTPRHSDSEEDCTGQVHVCGCCFSVLVTYEPIRNMWPVLEQTFPLDPAWIPGDMKPRNFTGKIFRPPIC